MGYEISRGAIQRNVLQRVQATTRDTTAAESAYMDYLFIKNRSHIYLMRGLLISGTFNFSLTSSLQKKAASNARELISTAAGTTLTQ